MLLSTSAKQYCRVCLNVFTTSGLCDILEGLTAGACWLLTGLGEDRSAKVSGESCLLWLEVFNDLLSEGNSTFGESLEASGSGFEVQVLIADHRWNRCVVPLAVSWLTNVASRVRAML